MTIQPLQAFQTAPAPPAAPAPAPDAGDATFSYNAQDRVSMPSTPTVIHGVQSGPRVEKAELRGGLKPVDGKYVYPEGDPRETAAISFAAVAKTVETFSKALGQPISWSFGDQKLGIIPDDGDNLNAFYSRYDGTLHFFHATDAITGGNIMSGASGEVVSHETGHAILDGLRPGYLGSWGSDAGAFHESFGDQMGMLMALQDDRTVARVAVQTGGDLTKPNILSALAEDLGRGINDFKGANATGGDWVRNAQNKFTWQDPSTLPDRGDAEHLGSEVHSFSRLWSGAFYDLLAGIQASNMAAGMDAKAALRATGDEGLKLLANLFKTAPQGEFTYKDMAQAFVASDRQFGGAKRADLITKVFTDRKILDGTPAPAPAPAPGGNPGGLVTFTAEGRKSLDDVTRPVSVRLSGPEYGIFSGARVETVVDRDGSLAKDAEVSQRTRATLKTLIDAGRIRYADPAQRLQPSDYFDKNGNPYVGVVRWNNGEMTIERVKITA